MTAIEFAVAAAAAALSAADWSGHEPIVLEAEGFAALPAEVALRLLGRAVARTGDEGPVQLGKLESLAGALGSACADGVRFRRTLAGAVVTLGHGRIAVERAPARRNRGAEVNPLRRAVRKGKKA